MSVPHDWMASAIMPSDLTAPDKKVSLTFGVEARLDELCRPVEGGEGNVQAGEDDRGDGDAHVVRRRERAREDGHDVDIAVATSPACEAQIVFEDSTHEATAKQIAKSLKERALQPEVRRL